MITGHELEKVHALTIEWARTPLREQQILIVQQDLNNCGVVTSDEQRDAAIAYTGRTMTSPRDLRQGEVRPVLEHLCTNTTGTASWTNYPPLTFLAHASELLGSDTVIRRSPAPVRLDGMTSIDGPLPDSDHLRQDINIPEEATLEKPGTSSPTSTTSSLNAGQHAAGISPTGGHGTQGQDNAGQDPATPTAEES